MSILYEEGHESWRFMDKGPRWLDLGTGSKMRNLVCLCNFSSFSSSSCVVCSCSVCLFFPNGMLRLLPTLCFQFQTIVQVPTRSKGRPNSTLPSSSQVPLPIWLPSFQVSNSKLPRFQCFIANLGLQCFRCHRCQALQVEWKGTSWDWEIIGISWIMLNAWSCWGYRRHSFSICNFLKIWLAFPGSFFPNFLDQTLGRWRRHDDDVTTTWRRCHIAATLPPHCRHIGCHNCHKTLVLFGPNWQK